jgi:tripartite ATP-independent transporter DctP family solute receptor
MSQAGSTRVTSGEGNQKAGGRMSRRQFVRGATVAAGAAALGTFSVPKVVFGRKFLRPIVVGSNARKGDPTYNAIAWIGDILKEKYGHEITFQMHHSSELGSDIDQVQATQNGFIDVTSNSYQNMGAFSKAWNWVNLPYAIVSREAAYRIYKSDVMTQTWAQAEKDMGVKVLSQVDGGGFRMLSNSKRAVRAPAEVQGLKVRVTQSPVEAAMVKAWGGNPTPIPWTETYTSIKQGVVDGMHVQPIWTFGFRFYEVLKHATEVGAAYSFDVVVMNRNTWNIFPKDVQDAILKAAEEAAARANKQDADAESAMTQNLKDKGMVIHTPSAEEAKAWRQAAMPVWEQFGNDKYGVTKQQIDRIRELNRV